MFIVYCWPHKTAQSYGGKKLLWPKVDRGKDYVDETGNTMLPDLSLQNSMCPLPMQIASRVQALHSKNKSYMAIQQPLCCAVKALFDIVPTPTFELKCFLAFQASDIAKKQEFVSLSCLASILQDTLLTLL